MQEASKGRVPSSIEAVAKREGIEPAKLARLVAVGRVVIPRNIRRERLQPTGIGELLTTKVNVNVGTSQNLDSPQSEVEKALAAVSAGADAVMDLSTGGDLDAVRRMILDAVSVPVGTVPIYNAAVKKDLTSQGFFNALEKHAKDGVDFVTVHVGVNKNSLERLRLDPRVLGVVSRGGSLTMKYISETGEDNPYYSEYDYLLEMAKEYDLTLSLGDGLRPGCIEDASDRAKYMEFIMLGEMVKRARAAGVQAMVEGPGHVPADEIETSVKAMKHLDGRSAPLPLGSAGHGHCARLRPHHRRYGRSDCGHGGSGLSLRHHALRAPGPSHQGGRDRGHLCDACGRPCRGPYPSGRAGEGKGLGFADGPRPRRAELGRAVSGGHKSGQSKVDPSPAGRGDGHLHHVLGAMCHPAGERGHGEGYE